jgi:hypothetical protein
VVRDGVLHIGSNALYSGMGLTTKEALPADCDIEMELAFDRQVGSDASFGITFKRGAGQFLCNLAYYPGGNRLKFWDWGAGGQGLIRWDQPLAWEPGRFYRLRLVVRGTRLEAFVDGERLGVGESPAASTPGPLRLGIYRGEGRCRSVRVKRPDGTPVFTESFDDPELPQWDSRDGSDHELLTAAAAAGIHLFQVGLHLHEFWRSPDAFDLGVFSARMAAALDGDPQAYILIRLHVNPPPFWVKAHPDEMCRGQTLDGTDSGPQRWPSFSSPVWRRDLAEALTELVHRIDREHWAGRLIGFQVMAAHGGEWVYHFTRTGFHDYSPCQVREFRNWLRGKYETDAALQTAWNDPDVTIDTAVVPPPAVRAHRDVWNELGRAPPADQPPERSNSIFIDPKRDRSLVDYKIFHNTSVTDAIFSAAEALKSGSSQKRVVGVYYGYHVPTTGSITNKGHSDIERLLQSPLIDMLACPLNYDQRDAGGTTLPQLAPASLRAHSKLFWIEDDSRTCYSPEGTRWRLPTVTATREVMKRTFAYALTKGGGEWWLDFGQRWFAHEPLLDLYAAFADLLATTQPEDRVSASQVVVVLQDQAYLRLLRNPSFTENLVYRQLLEECSRMGTPFDIAMLADLEKLPSYRLYIFPDAFFVSREQQDMIERVVRQTGRTALWIYAPALWTDAGLSAESASDLTGISLRTCAVSAVPDLRLRPDASAVTAGLAPAFRHVSPVRLDPVVVVDDPEAVPLGDMVLRFPRYPDGADAPVQPREIGLATKRVGQATAVYCGVPLIPASLLRGIARAAGVHLYTDGGETVYASRGFLSVHSESEGPLTIRLPADVIEVRDVFDEEQSSVTDGSFDVSLGAGETRIWKLIRQ